MAQRIIIIYLFFFDHTLCLFVNEYPWLDRYSFDVRCHKWCVSTLPVQKSIGFTIIFITLIFYSTTDHIWIFFKAIQKSVLETCRSQFFFYNIERTCRWLYMYNFNTFSYNIVVVTFFLTTSIEHLCKHCIEWMSCAMNLK
jgi:hypothetical protein